MTFKPTIAMIGGKEKTCPVFLKKLAQENLRLLFVHQEGEEIGGLVHQLILSDTAAEVESINCPKEGCWEADMIAFVNSDTIEANLVERIKEVATQKIVMCISTGEYEKKDFSGIQAGVLKQLLPHSKIIRVSLNSEEMKAQVWGENKEALDTITTMFQKQKYITNIDN